MTIQSTSGSFLPERIDAYPTELVAGYQVRPGRPLPGGRPQGGITIRTRWVPWP